jgi:hypothetical protein
MEVSESRPQLQRIVAAFGGGSGGVVVRGSGEPARVNALRMRESDWDLIRH